MLPSFTYARAGSLKEAIRELASEGARIHAGGTDLLGCLRDGVFEARKVVSINNLKDLRGIRETASGGLRIGSLTTITEVAESPLVRDRYAGLARGAAEVASPQLRNQGTIGGNLCQKPRCWYYRGEFHCLRKGGTVCYAVDGENQFHCIFGGDQCYIVHPSDTAPPLVALEAKVRIVGPRGSRTVAVEKFHVPPSQDVQKETVLETGEIVTEVLLPPPPPGLRSSYRKVRARRSWDFALAGVALALQFSGERVMKARVVLSGAAPIPWRAKGAEEVITGTTLDSGTIAKAATAVLENARPLEHNGYKVPLFQGLLEEQLSAIAG
jgi:xanthine dehydrogenase YagS FAD-binding subunit